MGLTLVPKRWFQILTTCRVITHEEDKCKIFWITNIKLDDKLTTRYTWAQTRGFNKCYVSVSCRVWSESSKQFLKIQGKQNESTIKHFWCACASKQYTDGLSYHQQLLFCVHLFVLVGRCIIITVAVCKYKWRCFIGPSKLPASHCLNKAQIFKP
jgi:hypothetical protein